MPVCQKCQAKFPIWLKVDGKKRNLKNRKFCLNCSPFGLHNTTDLTRGARIESSREKIIELRKKGSTVAEICKETSWSRRVICGILEKARAQGENFLSYSQSPGIEEQSHEKIKHLVCYTSFQGSLSEIAAIFRLSRAGYICSKPMIEQVAYDVLIDTGEKILRGQTKTARYSREGCFIFNRTGRTGTQEGFDVYVVYDKKCDEVYLIPKEDVPGRNPHFRTTPPKSGQIKGIRMASQYLV